jgi:feruloyl esterase
MIRKFASPSIALFFGCLPAHAQDSNTAAPSATDRLAVLRTLKIDAATITEVDPAPPTATVPNPSPSRTVVKLVLNPAKGSNINVEISLPDAQHWNTRLLALGNGGAAGHINSAGLVGPTASGYAVATTDMGTAPNSDSGIHNPEVWKDFGFRATHLMTVAAKQVIGAYYGKEPEYSYFSGGSTGGQQALQEAQRYPGDYDGIVATVPAHCRTPLHAYFLWNDQILKKCPFTKSQEDNVIAAGNDYMAKREIPPIAGKFVSDPRCTSQDIEAVIGLALQKDPSLTQDHAAALRKLFDGPKHAVTGERIFNGIPFGSALSAAHGHLYLFQWVFGADIDTYTAALGPYLNAENPDLSAFEKRGGKLIMTVGSADSVVPYHATVDYYERVIEHFGSLAKVQSFFLFYLVPGLSHGGGPGMNQPPSLTEVVRNWREKGIRPDFLQGRRVVDGKTEWEMPLYPYPQKTGWDASTSTYQPADGPRGGIDRVADRFRPSAAE